MAGEWQTVEIGTLCDGIFDGPHATPKKTPNGPLFLGISSLNNGRVDLSDPEYLSEEDFVKWTRRIAPRENDVVFSYETRLGAVALIPKGMRCCLGRRMALMRPNTDKVDPRFLLYAFIGSEFQGVIRKHTVHGSTVDRIPLLEFPHFPLRIPSLREQQAIACVLGALDDKIELNRRRNATLEGLARALFRSWFVDFDPVRAKAEGRAPVGMSAAVAALFPAALEDSALGPIPKGWRVATLGDVLTLQRGFDLPTPNRIPGRYPVVAASGESGTHNEFKVRGPGVTTGRSGVLGNVFFVLGDFWPLNTSLWVTEFKECTPAFAFHLLSEIDFGVFNAGSAVPTLNRNHIHNLPVAIPPRPLVDAFDNVALANLRRQRAADEESGTLAAVRDALLPKLISGELRVPDAERIVGRVM